MTNWEDYRKKLDKRKELSRRIEYNCERTKNYKDWELPIINRNEKEWNFNYRDEFESFSRLPFLLEDPAFKKLFEAYKKVEEASRNSPIWKSVPYTDDLISIECQITRIRIPISQILSDIKNKRKLKEEDYNSILDGSHFLYERLDYLKETIDKFVEKDL